MADFQSIIDRARITLNDPDKISYTDYDLLSLAEEGMFILQARRPDLFVGNLTSLPDEYLSTDTFPLSPRQIPALVNYIVARAELKDDEHAVRERASAFFSLFRYTVPSSGNN